MKIGRDGREGALGWAQSSLLPHHPPVKEDFLLLPHTHDIDHGARASSLHSNVSTQPIGPVRTAFEVAVSIAQETPRARTLTASIAAWIFPPRNVPAERAVALWYLGIPGATYRGLSYFDRQVSSFAPEEFSIARYLAKQGIGLVVIDTLGTGESQAEADGELITRSVTAEANAQVVDELRKRLTTGTLVAGLDVVAEDALFLGGFGHSMGAFQLTQLAALLEERGAPLDATIFAGWSHGQWDYERIGIDPAATLAAMVETNGYYAGGRQLLRTFFYGPQPSVPRELIEVDEQDATTFPKGLLLEGLTPGIVAQEASALRCPVLHVLAAHDVGSSAQSEGPLYTSSRLFTAYTQPQAAHCNFESSRHQYWRTIAAWTRMVAALSYPFHPGVS